MLNEVEGSKNLYTIVNTNERNDFTPTGGVKPYANQLRTDPDYSAQYDYYKQNEQNIEGGGGGTIRWNPAGQNVNVIGGITDNNPTSNLFHELAHGVDANRELMDSREVGGLERGEWQASFHEDIIRSQMG